MAIHTIRTTLDECVESSFLTIEGFNKAKDYGDDNTYAVMHLAKGADVRSVAVMTFNIPELPSDIRVDSIRCKIRAQVYIPSSYGYGDTRIKEVTAFLIDDDELMLSAGYWSPYVMSPTIKEIVLNGANYIPPEGMDKLKLVIVAKRGNEFVEAPFAIRLFGVELVFEYINLDDILHIKMAGNWVPVRHMYMKENGEWIEKDRSEGGHILEEGVYASILQNGDLEEIKAELEAGGSGQPE